MMMSLRQEKLPIAALERIDDLCAEFENAWQREQPPAIESVLTQAQSPTEREALLAELMALELDYRRRQGDPPSEQEYSDRFPEDAATVRRVWQLDEKTSGAVTFSPPTVARLSGLFPTLEIIELIGAGGMGAVYRARQTGLDRTVALKILPEEFGHDHKFALRFTREARALARLNHPNIVSVFEFGHVEDTYYFLMEYVDGSTLREVIQAKQLQPPQALAIVPYLCDALQYAHDQGVVHRDIKPENILLTRDGQVKIADFGLSRLLGAESNQDMLTGTHQVMGTLRYMAPEQMEGTHGVDHRADIYSLGVVIYEMLTGELPIGRFRAPSEKVQIDVRLDEVVLRTLEKEPRRRYQHASDIKSDLELIRGGSEQPLAPTVDIDHSTQVDETSPVARSAEQQELAGRLLLVRRELMGRVQQSLRPLFWGQILQMVFGVVLIAIGVQCWARNQEVPHRLISGVSLHVYGVLMVIAAGWICTRIKQIDYAKPVDEIRAALNVTQIQYLRFGGWLGFAWWLLWLPLFVAIGFDAVAYGPSLIVSLGIGVVGFGISMMLYHRFLRSAQPGSERWKTALAGGSLQAAHRSLDEMSEAKIT